jgi:hypothetical protein
MKTSVSIRVHPWFKTATVFLLVVSPRGLRADDDEVRFKAKTYAPGKSLNDAAYRAPAYAPRAGGAPAADTPLQTTSPGGRWTFFKRRQAEEPKRATDGRPAEATPYAQQKHISVPTVKANPLAIQEKKPFIASENGEAFTPAEKSGWKNPLLKPRQGIKEPAE